MIKTVFILLFRRIICCIECLCHRRDFSCKGRRYLKSKRNSFQKSNSPVIVTYLYELKIYNPRSGPYYIKHRLTSSAKHGLYNYLYDCYILCIKGKRFRIYTHLSL